MLNMIAKQVGMLSEGSIATALITTSHNVIRNVASCRRLLTVSVCSPYRYPWTACISLGCQFAFCCHQTIEFIFWYHIWRSATTRQQLYIVLQQDYTRYGLLQQNYICYFLLPPGYAVYILLPQNNTVDILLPHDIQIPIGIDSFGCLCAAMDNVLMKCKIFVWELL